MFDRAHIACQCVCDGRRSRNTGNGGCQHSRRLTVCYGDLLQCVFGECGNRRHAGKQDGRLLTQYRHRRLRQTHCRLHLHNKLARPIKPIARVHRLSLHGAQPHAVKGVAAVRQQAVCQGRQVGQGNVGGGQADRRTHRLVVEVGNGGEELEAGVATKGAACIVRLATRHCCQHADCNQYKHVSLHTCFFVYEKHGYP